MYTLLIMDRSETAFYKALGASIAQARKNLGLTQSELAVQLGIQQQALASYEVGRRRIPIETLVELSRKLYVDISDLVPGTPHLPEPKKPGPKPRLQREVERLHTLPADKQRLILDLIDSFASADTSHSR